MKFKNITIIGLVVLFFASASSCTNWLDLKPESEIVLENYWQTESDVNAVLASCYRGMTENSIIYRMIIWGELRSDNMVQTRSVSEDVRKILEGDLTANNGYCAWGSFYTVINYCNTLLYNAPNVVKLDENFTTTDLNNVRSEALTIRALCYFYLVRAFKEVPWIEAPSISDDQNFALPKEKEADLIQHIIADLLEAKKYARVEYPSNPLYNKARITLNSVNALLADVYLWDQQYGKCVEACNSILADPKLKLVEPSLMYTQVFYSGNSSESIFELQFNENIQTNFPVYDFYGSTDNNETGALSLPATLGVNLAKTPVVPGVFSPFYYKVSNTLIESDNDIRLKDWVKPVSDVYYIFKYAGIQRTDMGDGSSKYRYRSNTSNWIVYRLSDIMLMKAEALVQEDGESNKQEAIKMVNETYLRSNVTADSLQLASYPTQNDLSKLVLRERQRELMFEGKRWFDLVRLARREKSTNTLNDYVDHKSGANTVSLAIPVIDGLYFPIANSELRANKNLEQNLYYKETASSSTR